MNQPPRLRDFFAYDAAATFLNPNEFGEMHNVDGREILVVVDSDTLSERPRQPMELYNAANGVYLNEITLYLLASDMEDRPVVGQHLRLDGKRYPVSRCSESMGMLQIGLEANEA